MVRPPIDLWISDQNGGVSLFVKRDHESVNRDGRRASGAKDHVKASGSTSHGLNRDGTA